MRSVLNVLIACECSGKIREEFRRLGHNAWSCDLKPATDGSPYHIQGDALAAIRKGPPGGGKWDLIIAHPPCPRLALSGALRLYINGKKECGLDPRKTREMRESGSFFASFFEISARIGAKLAVENPIQHGMGRRAHGMGPPSQTIQPNQFGEDASKATCLWLRGLNPLVITHTPGGDLFSESSVAPRMVCGCGHVFISEQMDKYGCPNCNGEKIARPRWSNQTDSGQNKLAPSPTRAAARAVTYEGIAKAMAEQWGGDAL